MLQSWTKKVENFILILHKMRRDLSSPNPPHPKQCWSSENIRDQVTIQYCFGGRCGGAGGKENSSFGNLKRMCLKTIF